MLHVALHQPTIPPNTGNIARQCVGMSVMLHIIGPAGFAMDEASLRRAGLDHWKHLNWKLHAGPEDFLSWVGERRVWAITKFGKRRVDEPDYRDEDLLLFGSEVSGLPPAWLERWSDRTVRIPMPGPIRSYNLASAVALTLGLAMTKAGLWAE